MHHPTLSLYPVRVSISVPVTPVWLSRWTEPIRPTKPVAGPRPLSSYVNRSRMRVVLKIVVTLSVRNALHVGLTSIYAACTTPVLRRAFSIYPSGLLSLLPVLVIAIAGIAIVCMYACMHVWLPDGLDTGRKVWD